MGKALKKESIDNLPSGKGLRPSLELVPKETVQTEPRNSSQRRLKAISYPTLVIGACSSLILVFSAALINKAIAEHNYQHGKILQQMGAYSLAKNHLRKASSMGNGAASYLLAETYLLGMMKTNRNDNKAVEMAKIAATQGHHEAMHFLGNYYYKSAPDLKNAATWYQKAVDGDHVPAMVKLGTMYFNGMGVDKNMGRATALFKRASLTGDPAGQYFFGFAHYYGFGVKKDILSAQRLFKKAAKNGSNDALVALDTLKFD